MKMENFLFLSVLFIVTLGTSAQVEIDQYILLTGANGERSLQGLEAPVNGTDAVNKDYVDNTVSASGGGNSLPTMLSDESLSAMNLGDAIRYCNALVEGGFTDWRLSGFSDLIAAASTAASVTNNSSTNYIHFVEYNGSFFAASSIGGSSTSRYRAIRLSDGELERATWSSNTQAYFVRCVR